MAPGHRGGEVGDGGSGALGLLTALEGQWGPRAGGWALLAAVGMCLLAAAVGLWPELHTLCRPVPACQ